MTEAPSLYRAGSPDRGRAADVAYWLRGRLADGAQLAGDSRDVRPGDAFFAFAGARSDGRDFVGQALERGARVVLWQDDGPGPGDAHGSRDAHDPHAAHFSVQTPCSSRMPMNVVSRPA